MSPLVQHRPSSSPGAGSHAPPGKMHSAQGTTGYAAHNYPMCVGVSVARFGSLSGETQSFAEKVVPKPPNASHGAAPLRVCERCVSGAERTVVQAARVRRRRSRLWPDGHCRGGQFPVVALCLVVPGVVQLHAGGGSPSTVVWRNGVYVIRTARMVGTGWCYRCRLPPPRALRFSCAPSGAGAGPRPGRPPRESAPHHLSTPLL